jgi:YD repeat-containing protein
MRASFFHKPYNTLYDSNTLNQYKTVDGNSYQYDKNGNLTCDGARNYYYDCENRLTEVNDTGGTRLATYKYDYSGRRVSKTAGGAITKYTYDGDKIIAEYDSSETLLKKFVYGPGIDEPICLIVANGGNETRYYYQYE